MVPERSGMMSMNNKTVCVIGLGDLETSELAYRLAKYHFEQDGREILDATVGGKLQVFKKVDYQSLFESEE